MAPDQTQIGYSTTVIGSAPDLAGLLSLKPEIIEVCGYAPEAWEQVRTALLQSKVPVGLHCPIPFAGWIKQFDITGPPDRRQVALDLVRMTLDAARQVNAVYVLVHFPSVLRSPESSDLSTQTRYLEAALRSAEELNRMSAEYGIPVFLENVGPNPFFYSAQHFRSILAACPNLRFCFDPGHIHVLPDGEDVYAFAEELSDRIESVHLYGANPRTYRVGFHDPPLMTHQPADGWIDFPRLCRILAANPPRYLIFEYSADGAVNAEIADGVSQVKDSWRDACR